MIKKPSDKRRRKFRRKGGFWGNLGGFLEALGLISIIQREEEKRKRRRGY